MVDIFFILILLQLSYCVCLNNAINYTGPIVVVPEVGNIQGISGLKSEIEEREYFSFLGIEYGEPPIGKMRFKPTVLRKRYDEPIFNANKHGPACVQILSLPDSRINSPSHQYPFIPLIYQYLSTNNINQDANNTDIIIGSENCLVLDIHTPKLPNTGELVKLPVLVFIHGGGFSIGMSIMTSPRRFMDEDIVYVIIQYRLGPFGFLCLQTPEAPCNGGLYDQTLALQWVQKHISYFGGDPNQVTINGQSAGSASVSFHMISPLSKGLFHGIIGESGAAISPWALAQDPISDGMSFAWFSGCKTNKVTNAALCLQRMSAEDLIRMYGNFRGYCTSKFQTIFVVSIPCVQQNASLIGFEPFLSKPPIDILKSGSFNHVPALYGNVRDEGSIVTALYFLSYLLPQKLEYNKHFLKYDFVKGVLDQLGVDDPSGVTLDAIMRVYFDGLILGKFQSMVPGLTDMFGAVFLKSSTYETIKYNSLYNTSYFYSFDYLGEHTMYILTSYLEYLIPGGVPHAQELMYLNTPDFVFPLNETETLLSKKMIKMWTNFAYFRRPTLNESEDLDLPNWEPFTIVDPKFLRILSPTDLKMETDYPKLWTYEKDHALGLAKEENRIRNSFKESLERIKHTSIKDLNR